MHRILILALVSSLVLLIANQAVANSRFTVKNNSDTKVKVKIYNGGDKLCSATFKEKHIKIGETESYGCDGSGKHRCKVRLPKDMCVFETNACDSYAINVPNGETLTITGRYNCTIM